MFTTWKWYSEVQNQKQVIRTAIYPYELVPD